MRKTAKRATARCWAVVLLLLLGCILPPKLPRGRMEIPLRVERLLEEALREETDPDRLAYVRTACALTGQVGYFWGGKSHSLGWDGAWGWPRRVTAPGSETTGWIHPYGLDCSGFASWAAAAALEDPGAYELVGEGVREQYARSSPTLEPRPGDLAFYPDLSHVGVVLGRDRAGVIWVVHCSYSQGGVVVTPGSVGFIMYGTPEIFTEDGDIFHPTFQGID